MKRLKLKTKTIPKRNPQTTTLLIDGKYLAYRSRYSKGQSFLSHDSVRTGVYYGFFSAVKSAAKKFNANKIVIFWDFDSDKSVRKAYFPEYKMKRYTQPLTQFDMDLNKRFKEEYLNLTCMCEDSGFLGNYKEGYEADDLIALYCQNAPSNEKVIMITRDEDMYQCLKDNVSLYSPDDKIKKDLKWFQNEYGIEPTDWAMVKNLAGCKSDAVPGIPRVGEVTAIKYIKGESSDKELEKIEDGKSIIKRNTQLVTLPHPNLKGAEFDFRKVKIYLPEFVKMCQKYGFKMFLEEISEFEELFSGSY